MAVISDSMVLKQSPPRACIRMKGVIIKEISIRGVWLLCRRTNNVK